MRIQSLTFALALAGSTSAFSDSSPWILLSSSPLHGPDQYSMQTASQVLQYTKDALKSCPTDRYLLVNQPAVTYAELRGSSGCSIPSLCQAGEDTKTKGKYIVSEVLGAAENIHAIKDTGLATFIKDSCTKKKQDVKIAELDLGALSSQDLSGSFAQNDATLNEKLKSVMADGSYTVLFLSTPGERITHEVDFDEPIQMDTKRHLQGSNAPRKNKDDDWNNLPIFEKYQFFTPGIFMGLVASLFLFAILGVGIKALSSLEVSYGAFDKDMGPAAQKKQQ